MITKICECCGCEYTVPSWRPRAKYCSKKCANLSLHAPNNVVCTQCGKSFHVKASSLKRYNRHMGVFCSIECSAKYRETWFRGANNHQYGLKGPANSSFKGDVIYHMNHNLKEAYIYYPNHPYADNDGRVRIHRLLVEQNSNLYNPDYFEVINGVTVLKRGLSVHHIDGNHDNNSLDNLQVVTRSEHTSIHNKEKVIERDSKGRITGVFKRGELLGNHLNSGNQQPSSRSELK